MAKLDYEGAVLSSDMGAFSTGKSKQHKDKLFMLSIVQSSFYPLYRSVVYPAQFRSVGHILHMDDSRMPKQILYWYQEHWTPSTTIQRHSQKESQKLQDGPYHLAGIGRGQICLENHLSQGCPHI